MFDKKKARVIVERMDFSKLVMQSEISIAATTSTVSVACETAKMNDSLEISSYNRMPPKKVDTRRNLVNLFIHNLMLFFWLGKRSDNGYHGKYNGRCMLKLNIVPRSI